MTIPETLLIIISKFKCAIATSGINKVPMRFAKGDDSETGRYDKASSTVFLGGIILAKCN